MALPQLAVTTDRPHDPRALRILSKTLYRELRQSGLGSEHVMSVAGELLGLVASEIKQDRERTSG